MNLAAYTARLSAPDLTVPRLPGVGADRRALLIGAYAVAGATGIAAYYLLGNAASGMAFAATAALALAALLIGPRLYRPPNVLPWRVLAAGMAAFLFGDAVRVVMTIVGNTELGWLADIGYLGYVFIAVGIGLFIRVRRPRYRLNRLIDGLVIASVAALLIWLDTVDGIAGPISNSTALSLAVTPIFDAMILGATAYLVFAGGNLRGRAQLLLMAGIAATAFADLIYNAHSAQGGAGLSLANGLWMVSYLCLGMSALVPTMRELSEPTIDQPERAAGRAMLGLIGAIAVLTLINVADRWSVDPDGGWLEIAEMALVLLLFIRVRAASGLEAQREHRVAVLLANAAEALTVIGADGTIKLANPAAERILGIPAKDSVGRPIADFFERVHPDERAAMTRRLAQVMATPGASDIAMVTVLSQSGEYRSLKMTATNRINDAVIQGIVMNIRDVTDETRAMSDLHRVEAAIAQASDAVIIADAHANIEYVNPAFELITGYSASEVIGRNPRFLQSGVQQPGFYTAMWNTLTGGRPWTSDFINRRKDGSIYTAEAVVSPIRAESGAITGYVGVSRDVTEERRQVERSAQLARQRTLVRETIRGIDGHQSAEEIAQTVCSQLLQLTDLATAALVVFDTDGRATPYGLATANGKAPLRRLAKGRAELIRKRASGGPWIETWEPGIVHPYSRLLNGLGVKASAYAAVRDGAEMVGYLVITTAAASAEAVLTDALPALLEIAEICGTMLGTEISQRSAVDAHRQRLVQVADGIEFFPMYQPLVDLGTSAIVGYEALTRFDDGTPPDARFAEAHLLGEGQRLELAAIKAALAGAADLATSMWLNINASPSVVLESGAELKKLIAESGRDIVLEVTEHTEITDYAAFRREVHELGPRVRLAVDDAGAGFASLRHIVELRPSFVKLDRQVIAGIDHDEARQAMVAGLHHFAIATGCWLIAEGIETDEELATLKSLDVRYAQGYLLGRPVPVAKLKSRAQLAVVG